MDLRIVVVFITFVKTETGISHYYPTTLQKCLKDTQHSNYALMCAGFVANSKPHKL